MTPQTTDPPLETLSKRAVAKKRLAKISRHHAPKKLVVSVIILLSLSIITLGLTANCMYINLTRREQTLCDANLRAKPQAEVNQIIQNITDQMKLSIQLNGETITPTIDQLGVKIDRPATIEKAAGINDQQNFLSNFQPFNSCDMNIIASYSPDDITAYLKSIFPEYDTTYRDPTITVVDNWYTVDRGNVGTTFDISGITSSLDDMLRNPRPLSTSIRVVETAPSSEIIKKYQATADTLNQIIDNSYAISYGGYFSYRPSRADLISTVDLIHDSTSASYSYAFDPARITELINQNVTYQLNSSVQSEKALTYPNGTRFVTQKGRNGVQVTNASALSDNLTSAIIQNHDIGLTVLTNITPYAVEETAVTNSKWIEINLSEPAVYLWNGDQLLARFGTIAIGAYYTPTIAGNFAVRSKVALQDMYGEGWRYNNIHWVTYWYGDYAFHEAWWMQPWQVGTGISHGCVNMTLNDAKTVFDFAEIGTPVYSHY